ncbi:EGF-like domain family protein [Acanthocheilonema viteae]
MLNNILGFLALRLCESNVCLNGGTCKVNDENRSFQCFCPAGYDGLLCEKEKVCSLQCHNNGICIFTDNGKPKCNCLEEFSGELCEIGSIDCQVQGCSIGERCTVTEGGKWRCMSNPCMPNPCKHNATCTPNKDTGFKCRCTNGFEGALCADDIDECMNTPCKNDAICMNSLGSFICLCKDGFRGSLCEENTLCDPNPCFNNGICSIIDGFYYCNCQPGFTSDRCQEQIKEECNCKSDKQICINGICKCPDGFMGKDCDQPLSWSCVRNEGCENGGTCLETTGNCICPPGFTGIRCEHALECTVDGNPCIHGSCIWSTKGTICNCKNGFEGKNCERNISEMLNPCLFRSCNTGQCMNKNGSAVCICPEENSGEFCENTDICRTKPCMNGGKCLIDFTNTSNFKCICDEHFSGTFCELKVHETECVPECTADEICEQRNGIFTCIKLQNTLQQDITSSTEITCDDCVHSFRCIENDKNAVCVCDVSWTGSKCDQQIEECQSLPCTQHQICRNDPTNTGTITACGCAPGLTGINCTINTAVTFHNTSFFLYQSSNNFLGSPQSDYTLKVTFRTTVDDANILSAEDILSQIQFALNIRNGYLYGNFTDFVYRKLLPFAVNDDHWYTVLFNNTNKIVMLEIREGDFVLSRVKIKEEKNMGIYWTRIGKGRGDGFRGCIRDLFINGEFIDMLKSANVFGVIDGCQRSKLCSPNPCQNNGICIDRWDEFRCECKKPFLSPYCIQQTDEVTFGYDNLKSRLELDGNENLEDIKLKTNIDFLIRTNKPNGTLLYLGEKDNDDIGTFIVLEIFNGFLNIRTRLGGKKIFVRSISDKIDDNKVHLINLIRDRNNFTITIDDIAETKFDVENRFDHPLLADTLILGSNEYLPVDAFSTNDYFKGTLQDLRINNHLVPLKTLSTDIEIQQFGNPIKADNILQGTVSDDICALLKPCVNGQCSNTFNDFECICEYSWIGKRCNERDHCALSSCSVNTTCTNYNGGYVCSSPATFVPTSFAKYKLENGDAMKNDISKSLKINFALRTRSLSGQIIYLKTSTSYLSVSLNDGLLIYDTLINGDMKKQIFINMKVNDGVQHSIDMNHSGLYIDGKLSAKNSSFILPINAFDFTDNFILIIGQRNAEIPSFDGCLENIQIGRAPPISFFIGNQSGGLLENTMHFKLMKRRNIIDNRCYADDLCGLVSPCKNDAVCRDLWNKRVCECRPGYTGTFCEIRIDRCKNHNCKFGICINDVDEYSCVCLPGYDGKFCDKEMNLCKLSPCLNGGNCTMSKSKYNCHCPIDFVGSRCQALKSSKCIPSPCENGANCTIVQNTFKCDCPPHFGGILCDIQKDMCELNPCKNGAICLSENGDFKCICANGYEGRICDEMKDYCKALPCLHGHCKTISDNFLCECDSGWSGEHCDVDINECMRFPCENDGNCTNTPGSYQCSCDSYYLGDRCEIAGSCVEGPCGDNGDCIQLTSTTHSCVCRRGYTGDICDTIIDYCSPNPCENGATCQGFIGDFNCSCLPGFTGERCSVDIDDCVDKVCQNGGRCIDRVNGYECNCEGTGYQGIHCTDDINECDLGICVHGRCTNLIGSYNCDCDIGYIGKQCTLEDPCIPDDLNRTRHDCVHGTCVHPTVGIKNNKQVANYECKCEFGYSGEYCIHLIEKRKPILLGYIAGPIIALIIALLIIGFVLLTIVMIRGRRATQGTYSPSHHENSISRMPMNSMLTSPPEERLI